MKLARFLLIFIYGFSYSQVSISDIKRAGIKSEQDLINMGFTQSEINSLKKNSDQSETLQKDSTEKNTETPLENPKNERKIILESKKEKLKKEAVYGQSIFNSGAVLIQKNSDRIKAKDNYIIGSGDIISITIWGFSEFNNNFTVDDLGNIRPKLVGRINLKGQSFGNAKKIIKSKFSKVYDLRSSNMAIELSYSKVISVNVMGEVFSPGTYSVPSINSAFNILSLAKGPNQRGSVRNISVIRNGETIHNLDIYQYMNSPKKSSFAHLMDGDFIIVPTLGKVVSIGGEVVRGGDYELKEGETLQDLIQFAGGFNAKANMKQISIIRNTFNGKEIQSFSRAEAENVQLKKGDEVIISKVSDIITNQVSVKGEVVGPGVFDFKQGESLMELINRARGLTTEAYINTAHIYRLNNNLEREILQINLSDSKALKNTTVNNLDEVYIFSKKSFLDTTHVIVNGLVRNPGQIVFKEKMTLNDILTLVGGAQINADLSRLEIERIDFNASEKDTFNYVKILTKNILTDADFKIQPFDIINIRSLPEFKFQESIEVKGEVKYPGIYSLSGSQVRTADIIKRAGGLTKLAYGEKAYIQRAADSLGLILLDLDLVSKKETSKFNYILRPGDTIVIPRVNDIVSISGATGVKFLNNDKINAPFTKNKFTGYYLRKYAGGYDKKADKKNVYVITLNGQVKHTKFYGLRKPKVEKGDKIIVNYKAEKEKKEKKEKINWNSQIENLTVKLTGIATLWILISSSIN
ncbi:MAG: hypothetical protein CMP63_08285 [Flavobacteriales bacterium]|nr:hypothetical protein [Flavobacteriales bacterium]